MEKIEWLIKKNKLNKRGDFMKKYEYDFVTVKTTGLWYDDYQEIIKKHGEEGWRYVDSIDKSRDFVDANPRLELVFERELVTEGEQ